MSGRQARAAKRRPYTYWRASVTMPPLRRIGSRLAPDVFAVPAVRVWGSLDGLRWKRVYHVPFTMQQPDGAGV